MQSAECIVQNGRPERKADDGRERTGRRRSQVKVQKAEARRQRPRLTEGRGKQILAGTEDVRSSLSSRLDGMSWSKPTKAGR